MDTEKSFILPESVFGLYGSGGFAREVMSFASESLPAALKLQSDVPCRTIFVEQEPQKRELNGYSLISEKDFFAIDANRFFNVAVGDSQARERIATELIKRSAIPLSVQSPHALVYDCNVIDHGAILCANTMITSNARIGKFFHLNIYSYVAHDCIIGDYVTFAPNVQCNGNVHIHNHAYIGTGAVIKQGFPSKPLIIGEGAVIGMGAVVTKDVPPFMTVVGNPAKLHQKT